METGKVYEAIGKITEALSEIGIAKSQRNRDQGFMYRGIEDVMNELGPLLAKFKLRIFPHMDSAELKEGRTKSGAVQVHYIVHMTFTFVSEEDGSTHSIQWIGEAKDVGDKGVAKAAAVAFKYAMLYVFCVPTEGMDDPDSSVPPETMHHGDEVIGQPRGKSPPAARKVTKPAEKPMPPKALTDKEVESVLSTIEAAASEGDDERLRMIGAEVLQVQTDHKASHIADQVVKHRVSLAASPEQVESVSKMIAVFQDRNLIAEDYANMMSELLLEGAEANGES